MPDAPEPTHLDQLAPQRPQVKPGRGAPGMGPADLPVVRVGEAELLSDWLVLGPVEADVDALAACGIFEEIARGRVGRADRVTLLGRTVEAHDLAPEQIHRAGKGWIDLSGNFEGEATKAVLLFARLAVPADTIVRVHLDRLRAVMRIGLDLWQDGDFVRLPAGEYALALAADSRRDYSWDPLFVSPRLTVCTPEQIDALHRSRVARWTAAKEAAQGDPAGSVHILPHTVIGTEGFVRVGRTEEGFWWLIDADGRPFYYRGVCAVNRAGTQGGRRAVPGPYAETVDAKYDYPHDPQAFVRACLSRLRQWGFNALGSWTTEEFFERGAYCTDNVEFYHGYDKLPTAGCCDVFDPGWRAFIDRKAREICSPQKENRQLVGYFTENEIGFRSVGAVALDEVGQPVLTGARPSLLQKCLAESPAACAHREAWRFVLARRGGRLDRAAEAWNVPLASPDDLRRMTEAGDVLVSDAFAADADTFAAHFAETFFRCAAQAVRRYDPNHLILGCRWAGPQPPAVMAAEARWVDVVSVNNYQDMFYERIDEHPNPLGLPVLIGEFCWSDDSHMTIEMPFEPSVGLTACERMVAAGGKALRRVFCHPNVVGWTWYRWIASNPLGSPRNCGLVDECDEPHPWNTAALPAVHARAERVRVDAAAATTGRVQPFDGRLVVVLRDASILSKAGQRYPRKVVFGVVVADGAVRAVTGYGVRGRVTGGGFEDGSLRFAVELEFTDVVFPRGDGRARYDVALSGITSAALSAAGEGSNNSSRDAHLTGTYEGEYNGAPVSGPVSAWRE